MADLVIAGEVARRVQEIADQEHRPVEDVLRSMLSSYEAQKAKPDPIASFRDGFSGKAFDLSKTVKATSENHYRKKYGDSD